MSNSWMGIGLSLLAPSVFSAPEVLSRTTVMPELLLFCCRSTAMSMPPLRWMLPCQRHQRDNWRDANEEP